MTEVLSISTAFPSSMSLIGNEKSDGYYHSSSHLPLLGHHQQSQQSFYEQKSHDFRLSNQTPLSVDSRGLPPSGPLAPILPPTSAYSSSPTSGGLPTSYQRQHYGPITNQGQPSPQHMVFMDQHPTQYSQSHQQTQSYSSAGSPENTSANQLMRPSVYHQPSPVSALPSPHSAYGRSMYGYGSTPYGSGAQQHPNYIHQPGTMPHPSGRASFSMPQSATTPTYARYSQPPTPQLPRDPSAMYPHVPSNAMSIHTPRQAPIPTYTTSAPSIVKPSPPSRPHNVAAPGPIPATTPIVIKDAEGRSRIRFVYSKDKNKKEYSIRCDIETVDIAALSPSFKEANLVYPRAYMKDDYRGNRLAYETQCNEIGWALTHLNPELRENRGATQRAVDSWRNSAADQKMRSRRVRRQAKQTRRQIQQQQTKASQQSVVAGKTVGYMAMQQAQRSLLDNPAKDSHQHKLPSSKSNDELDVSLPPIAAPTTSTSTSPTDSRYAASHLQQTYSLPAEQGGMTSGIGYHSAQDYEQDAQANVSYSSTQYAPQAGSTHYGYSVHSG